MSFWDKLAAIEIPNSLSFAVTVISTLVAVVASVYAFAVKRPSVQVRVHSLTRSLSFLR